MADRTMTWDLQPLVVSTQPDRVKAEMDRWVTDAKQLESEYKGKLASLDATGLLTFLKRWETHLLGREGVLKYASLRYAANSLDPEAKQLSDLGRKTGMLIRQAQAFVEVEGSQLLAKNPGLIGNPVLKEYKHSLERLLRAAPHYLSEIEERLLIQKDRFGIDAWYQLQNDWLTTRSYEITVEGKKKTLPYGEIVGLYEHPKRQVRKDAYRIVEGALGRDEILWASALRAIVGDHLATCKARKWPTPLTQSLIDNDVDEGTIKALMSTVEKHANLYRRYLRLKARLMKLPKLANYDILAPLPGMPDRKFSWTEARKLVVEAYSSFDANIARLVDDMYDKRRIDAEVRKGKASGAFCSFWLKGKTAYVLQSFNGILGDIFTSAHENGHAIHATLVSQKQSPLNSEISFGVAETASIFGELLLTDKLIAEAKTPAEKIEVLAKVIDEFGMTVFQVSARFLFETALYDAFERGEYLDGETIAKYWTQNRDRIYGDAIHWLDEMKWEWTFKQHYYIPRFRFYNWPYVFAGLFVFALYRLYKEQGRAFAPKLVQVLSAGSTLSPRDLIATLGFDITTPAFWELGMKQSEAFIAELESLVK
jgi:oligoendopeptidase F